MTFDPKHAARIVVLERAHAHLIGSPHMQAELQTVINGLKQDLLDAWQEWLKGPLL